MLGARRDPTLGGMQGGGAPGSQVHGNPGVPARPSAAPGAGAQQARRRGAPGTSQARADVWGGRSRGAPGLCAPPWGTRKQAGQKARGVPRAEQGVEGTPEVRGSRTAGPSSSTTLRKQRGKEVTSGQGRWTGPGVRAPGRAPTGGLLSQAPGSSGSVPPRGPRHPGVPPPRQGPRPAPHLCPPASAGP